MTNYEHYREQIEKIVRMGVSIGVRKDTREVALCVAGVKCTNCLFQINAPGERCTTNKLKWADEEYIEPSIDWTKVPVDTPILVSDDEKHWHRRYFAKRSDGKFYAFSDGSTSWSAEVGHVTSWLYAKLAGAENNESEQNL